MTKIESNDVVFQEVTYADEDAIYEICKDWSNDGHRFTRTRAEKAVGKYVLDMESDQRNHPALPNSAYTETLIAYHPNGDPLALISYTVRGSADPKNAEPETTVYTHFFIIAKKHRGQGKSKGMIDTLFRGAFENAGADLVVHDIVDTPEMESHRADRYSKEESRTNERGDTRFHVNFSKADHEARMLAKPDEKNMKHIFIS